MMCVWTPEEAQEHGRPKHMGRQQPQQTSHQESKASWALNQELQQEHVISSSSTKTFQLPTCRFFLPPNEDHKILITGSWRV